jgi:AGZA family xanthine/uracil permease-like MFS transporter
MSVIMNVVTLGLVDLFDTIGTIVGCTAATPLVDEHGRPHAYGKIMTADAIAAVIAALLGTSSVTTFVESGAGIAVGGKTGLVAVAVSGAFLLSIFFLPLFAFIPLAASGAALIYVGVLMMGTVNDLDFSEMHNALPAFITITMMPFTFSITKGIGMGMLSYVVLELAQWIGDIGIYCWKCRMNEGLQWPKWPIGTMTGVITILFLIYFFVPIPE